MAKAPRQTFYLRVTFMRECCGIDILQVFSVLQQARSRRLNTQLTGSLLSTEVLIPFFFNRNLPDYNDNEVFNRSMDVHDNKSQLISCHCRCLNSSHIRNFTRSKSTLNVDLCSLYREYFRRNANFTFISTRFSQMHFKPFFLF